MAAELGDNFKNRCNFGWGGVMSSANFGTTWLTTEDLFGGAEEAVIDLLRRRLDIEDEVVLGAAALAVLAHRNGHSCLLLSDIEGLFQSVFSVTETTEFLKLIPSATEFTERLSAYPAVVRVITDTLVGTSEEASIDLRPFVLLGDRLFTQRQYVDELSIAEQLSNRAGRKSGISFNSASVDRVVPVPDSDDKEALKVGDTGIANRAAKSVISNCLTVLTGGPGTGKTHTLTRCLAILLASREEDLDNLSVALVAPTGKAAARAKELLDEFVKQEGDPEKAHVGVSSKVLEALTRIEPKTIQRVLGSRNRLQTRFAHDAKNQLPHDVVVIDEMSMVASNLMARLLEAIKPEATILLVGDDAQLESVESGSVLRDIVEAAQDAGNPLAENMFELLKVWRQSGETRIGDLARHIRAGEGELAINLAMSSPDGVEFVNANKNGDVPDSIINELVAQLSIARDMAAMPSLDRHKTAYEVMMHNKVLCGPREGDLGVNRWNTLVSNRVHGINDGEIFRPGTPLLVTVNSPRVQLVNGDIGLVVNFQDMDGTNQLRIYFRTKEGGRYLTPAELPPIMPCYAMTVHKSQGSEYNHLVFVLPNEKSPLLTRELVYTAITRAKKTVLIAGTSKAFTAAVDNKSVRHSGLRMLLRLV